MMRIAFSPGAQRDLREIAEFIAQDNIDAAILLIKRLKQRCDDLAQFPDMGRRRDDVRPGYRSIVEGNYVIWYRKIDAELVIMRILHGKRDISRALRD